MDALRCPVGAFGAAQRPRYGPASKENDREKLHRAEHLKVPSDCLFTNHSQKNFSPMGCATMLK
jgi:hypothetical protein